MAQVDTGLGWSAKGTYLREPALLLGSISTFGGPDFPGQPIPKNATTNDEVLAKGFKIAYQPAYSAEYYVATEGEANVLIYFTSNPNGYVHFISNSNTEYVRLIRYRVDTHVIQTGDRKVATTPVVIGGNTVYHGMLSDAGFGSSWMQYLTSYIPSFTDDNDADSHVIISAIDFNKVNAGYAVACVAKWKTSTGTIIQTPILISSDSSFTDMSTTGTYQFAKYNTRRDGIKFYMSYYQDISDNISTTLPVYDISGPDDPYANLDEIFNLICALDQANVTVTETVDPYEDFPHTDEDGGEVDPDPEDDEIEEADLPTMSFATAGFCRIYRPSFAQVSALASYMWTDNDFLQTVINHLKQILENPIDAIISLSIVPCVPNVLADEEVKVMYVPTGVYMPPVQRQFVSVDCGTYTLKEMYGSALDYNPYTSVQLYLPYVGIVQLDTDEVMGKTISIGYRIDVVTGVCCAYVKAGGDVLYQFSGHCSIQQPITSADFSGYINAALAAGKLVASIAAAGAGAPAVAATLAGAPTPSISGTESKTVETERNPNTGRQITVGTRKRESQTYNPGASFGEVATRGVSNTVGAVMNSKTIVQHSGGFSGNSGFMAAVRRPYLIVTRPRIANPENYGKYNGRPSMIYLNLGDCTGFTQVQSIQLTGIDATNPELSEIVTLLNSGVIL